MKKSTFGTLVLMAAGAFSFAIAGNGLAQAATGSGMASEPAGIGEKGTGQTQSSMERSGGGQSNR